MGGLRATDTLEERIEVSSVSLDTRRQKFSRTHLNLDPIDPHL